MSEKEKIDLLASNFRKLEESRKNYIRKLTRKLADIHCDGEIMDSRKTPKRTAIKTRLIMPLMMVFMSCISTTPANDVVVPGESSPLLSGTRWEYRADDSTNPVYYIELNQNGDAIWYDVENNMVIHLTSESTWSRQGNTVTIPHNSGYRHIEGTLVIDQNTRKIIGTGTNRHNKEWKFTMIEK